MALARAVAGARRPSQTITWTRETDGVAESLAGATLTGVILLDPLPAKAITGALTIVTAAAGIFRWDYSAADVAIAGKCRVQFTATFGSGQTPAKTFVTEWIVAESI